MGNPQTKFRSVVAVKARFLKQQKIKHMDTLSIIAVIAAFAAVGGLAWLGGYELGQANAQDAPPRRPTVAELVNELKPRRPKAARNRRKAARKAVRA
jgi:hypothetical protein